jgi:hypothetical protein
VPLDEVGEVLDLLGLVVVGAVVDAGDAHGAGPGRRRRQLLGLDAGRRAGALLPEAPGQAEPALPAGPARLARAEPRLVVDRRVAGDARADRQLRRRHGLRPGGRLLGPHARLLGRVRRLVLSFHS